MSQELYTYIRQMHHFVQMQQKRINHLEKTLKEIKLEIEQLNKRPPVHVDNIEYKFDQLKVETLDGTLNIGLNPSDLGDIDSLEVDNQKQSPSLSPKKKMESTMKLEDSLYRYLDSDLNSLVKEYGSQAGVEVNEDFITFIKEDIKKQLPSRINEYLKKYKTQDRSDEAIQFMLEQVEKQIKDDIGNAVLAFLNNLPKRK